jgi:hypothetical protein
MRFAKSASILAATALVALPTAVQAQAWIGLMVGNMMSQQAAYAQEVACMTGTPMVDKEVAEASTPAPGVMRSYWQAASAGTAPTSVFLIDKKTRWISAGKELTQTNLATLVDPFARSGGSLVEAPIGFVRAGDAQSALGQWVVRDGAGKRIGTYQGLFRRKTGQWLLSTLTLVSAKEWVDPVVQYCHAPGDVLPYRIATSARALEFATKQEAKAQVKAGDAQAKAEKAQGVAAAAPGNSTKAATAALARQDAVRRETTLIQRRTALQAARDNDAAAKKAQQDYDAMASAGKAALLSTG